MKFFNFIVIARSEATKQSLELLIPKFTQMNPGFVYIMTNKNNTVLYTGVTSNLPKRVQEHKEKFHEMSFTSKYNLNKLVYWQSFQEIGDAIFREKQIKVCS